MTNVIVYYLLAVASIAVTCASPERKELKLKEVLKDLDLLKANLESTSVTLHTPSKYSECCALSALGCFRINLQTVLTSRKSLLRKISSSLKSDLVVKSVNTCTQAESQNETCHACDFYPKTESKIFIDELGSLLKKAYSGLMYKKNMNTSER